MATAKEQSSIAVLNTKVEALAKTMDNLNTRFDVFQTNFIRNDVYTLRHEELAKLVAAQGADIRTLKNFRWILATASIAVAGIFVYLIEYALHH